MHQFIYPPSVSYLHFNPINILIFANTYFLISQVPDASKPGELKVHFNPSPGQKVAPFDAPYWVLELGPVNGDGQYDYAIVSDNKSSFLFVRISVFLL